MELHAAEAIAQALIDILGEACLKIQVAGSVRRRKVQVNDIEICAVAKPGPAVGMFDDISNLDRRSALELLIDDLRERGVIAADPLLKRNGAKAKRFIFQGAPIDLFIADEGNYGNILSIRTGDAAFSHRLVTARKLGGFMPAYLRQKDGYLWRGIERVPCPTEEAFFAALGLAWLEPSKRTGLTPSLMASLLMGAKHE